MKMKKMIMKKMIIKKVRLVTLYADCYIYLLPIRLLYVYNSIKTYLYLDSKNRYVNMLSFLYNIILGLIICCPFLFIGLIFATLSIDVINIMDDHFVFMDGNPNNYSNNQPGNPFGGSGGPGSSGGFGPPSGENNNLVPLSSDNSENRNENQQVSYYTEELQDQILKERMAGRLDRYRIANAHLRDIYLDDSFTSAEHEYIADKIFQDRAAKSLIYGPNSQRTNFYANFVEGSYPDRRYVGKVTRGFINSVFS